MTGGWPDKPNLEWREGLTWCCGTLGYISPSDRWDHVEESTEAMIADYERRTAAKAAENSDRPLMNEAGVTDQPGNGA